MTHPLADEVIETTDGASARRLRVIASERSDGDVHPGNVERPILRDRQIAATGHTWTMLDQVHGVDALEALVPDDLSVSVPGNTSGVGDVLYTRAFDAHIAVWAADCAPLVLAADDGMLVAAHGGWRGLAAGVIDAAIGVAQRDGGAVTSAILGPVIGPCCYEFGDGDLATIPDAVEGRTTSGAAALDVSATIAASLRRHDIELLAASGCTGCDDRWFSHRVRSEPGRHAVVAWWEAAR